MRFTDHSGFLTGEPLRADLKESLKGGGSRSIAPKLYDYELAISMLIQWFPFSANFYYMDYKDQLVQTGKLE